MLCNIVVVVVAVVLSSSRLLLVDVTAAVVVFLELLLGLEVVTKLKKEVSCKLDGTFQI